MGGMWGFVVRTCKREVVFVFWGKIGGKRTYYSMVKNGTGRRKVGMDEGREKELGA